MSKEDPLPQHIPTPVEMEAMQKGWASVRDLLHVVYSDFETARHWQLEMGDTPFDRRSVVRCFGSYVDGLAVAMREYTFSLCLLFQQPTNRFLYDKTEERSTTAHQRIYTCYRFITGFLPGSPLARVPDSRWDQLHRALEIRNRIVHPHTVADFDISESEIELVLQLGADFMQDYRQFLVWFDEKQQRIVWSLPGQKRQRSAPKLGRNDLCRCGSGRKHKNCCAGAAS